MGIENLKEKREIIVSWNDMGKRVLRPLQIKLNIVLVLLTASGVSLYFVKDLKIVIPIMVSMFVYVGFFIYYKKRIEKVKKLIYQWGAVDVYKHYYPEEFAERFGKDDIDNSLYNRESKIKNRLSKIEEITKKYDNE
jgi:hypothetical protein